MAYETIKNNPVESDAFLLKEAHENEIRIQKSGELREKFEFNVAKNSDNYKERDILKFKIIKTTEDECNVDSTLTANQTALFELFKTELQNSNFIRQYVVLKRLYKHMLMYSESFNYKDALQGILTGFENKIDRILIYLLI